MSIILSMFWGLIWAALSHRLGIDINEFLWWAIMLFGSIVITFSIESNK